MARSEQDRLDRKKTQLIERTALALGCTRAEASRLLSIGRLQSIRINPLKTDNGILEELASLGWHGEAVPWCQNGYTMSSGYQAVASSKAAQDGLVYVQNAASWLPVLALNPQSHDTILDICAAPGGKTSHIAALTSNQSLITANDNSRPRLNRLQANLDRMGVTNTTYTLFDARMLSNKLAGQLYDKILLDAPCSGEGMMTLVDDKSFASWSVAHIKRLQSLQKKLIVQAWQLLKPGGTLVYSTCTMAPEENEAVVDYFLRHNTDAQVVPFSIDGLSNVSPAVLEWNGKHYRSDISGSLRLHPSELVEAFYVCILHKLDSTVERL